MREGGREGGGLGSHNVGKLTSSASSDAAGWMAGPSGFAAVGSNVAGTKLWGIVIIARPKKMYIEAEEGISK